MITLSQDIKFLITINLFHTMQAQQILSQNPKSPSKIIDQDKIKTLLSKKLVKKVSNPEQTIKEFDDELLYHIEKAEDEIGRQFEREEKIKKVQSEQLKLRGQLHEKINHKILKSTQNREKQTKQWLQGRLKARKLRDQQIQNCKRQMKENEFKARFEKFKSIQSQNKFNRSTISQEIRNIKNQQKKHSHTKYSVTINNKSSLDYAAKSREVDQFKYFKTLQQISKRKIYDKMERKTYVFKSVGKLQTYEKLQDDQRNKFIQKLGMDLTRVEEARVKKEKSFKDKLEKIKKQAQLFQEQRSYRLQILKSDNLEKLKTKKEILYKKSQRCFDFKNNSTSNLNRNWSNYSSLSKNYNEDQQKDKAYATYSPSPSKMSKTLQNFSLKLQSEKEKAANYLSKEKQKKLNNQIKDSIEKVVKEEKIQILMKR